MNWSTACPDWAERLKERRSIIPAPLFPTEAAAGLAVLDELRIADMPGAPAFGEISRPWVRDLAAAIFGAYEEETGRQMIREYFLLISKKNTKSTTAGLLMLAILIRNWRPAGEFGILAPTVEVANNAFKPAADAIRADAELTALFHVQDHVRTITHRPSKATLQVVAADSDAVAGKKWIVTLVDELWLFGKKHNAENMLREATGGQASRDEGFVIYSSTQSDEPPAGVFAQKLKYARDVRDGIVNDPQFLPILYEFPAKMIEQGEHRDAANFYITNPNLGASVNEAWLTRELDKAELAGVESLSGFLAKHLNVEVGMNLRSDRWAGAEFWEAAGTGPRSLEELIGRSEVLTIGIDGGGLDDLLGLAVIGRDKLTRQWMHWGRAWAHPSVLERRKAEAPRLKDFAAAGELAIVQAIGPDVVEVAALVKRVEESQKLASIGVDPAGIGDIVEAIQEASKSAGEKVIGIRQGWTLTSAIKTTERALAEGRLVHAGQSMMAWSAGNAKIVPAGNAVLVTKQASGSAKIDPLLALFNAVDLMSRNPASPMRDYKLSFA